MKNRSRSKNSKQVLEPGRNTSSQDLTVYQPPRPSKSPKWLYVAMMAILSGAGSAMFTNHLPDTWKLVYSGVLGAFIGAYVATAGDEKHAKD